MKKSDIALISLLIVALILAYASSQAQEKPVKTDTLALQRAILQQFTTEIPVTILCGVKDGKVIYVLGYQKSGMFFDSKHKPLPLYVLIFNVTAREVKKK